MKRHRRRTLRRWRDATGTMRGDVAQYTGGEFVAQARAEERRARVRERGSNGIEGKYVWGFVKLGVLGILNLAALGFVGHDIYKYATRGR
jgi:hypothetical protein